MMPTVTIIHEGKTRSLRCKATILQGLLREISLNPEEIIIEKNGEYTVLEDTLQSGDIIRIITFSSQG